MSNKNGLISHKEKLNALLKAIEKEQDPNTSDRFGVEHFEQLIEFLAETYAEVKLSVQNKDINAKFRGLIKALKRFGNNFVDAAALLDKAAILAKEIKDTNSKEGAYLIERLDFYINDNFKRLGLNVEDSDSKVILLVLELAASLFS